MMEALKKLDENYINLTFAQRMFIWIAGLTGGTIDLIYYYGILM